MFEQSSDAVLSTVVALGTFSFATSITPGPNNFMLLSSGARSGFRATVPHMLGVSSGMAGLMTLSYFGVGTLAADQPGLNRVMTWLCALYMAWLAIKLLRDRTPQRQASGASAARPMTLVQAATFQLMNPKGWAMALTAAATALAPNLGWALGITLLLGVFTIVNLPCLAVWTLWGALIRRFLEKPHMKLAFDVVMAILLLTTAAAMVWGIGPV